MEECLHCHATVLMMSDQQCPACQKFASDPKGATPQLTRIVVGAGWVLPSVCIRCGLPSLRRESLTSEEEAGDDAMPLKVLLFIVGWLNPINWLKLALLQGEQRALGVELSQCESCANEGPIRPVRADFQRGAMVLLVHRRLAAAIRGVPDARR